MFGASNDWFFGAGEQGIPLFDARGAPIDGDVSSQVVLWDAGSEENEEPAVGPHTGPQQSSPDDGPADANPNVRPLASSEYAARATSHLRVTVSPRP